MNLDDLRHRSPVLARISATEPAFFESVRRDVTLRTGEVLFDEAAPAEEFFVVTEGLVGLEMTAPGRPPMTIQTLGTGDLVGVSWFFPPYKWNWRARAVTDSTLVAFDAQAVRTRCAVDRDLELEVLRALATEAVARLHGTRLRLLDLYGSA